MITVPLDQTLISEDKATVVIFNTSGRILAQPTEVVIDDEIVGVISPEVPLRLEVEEGDHEFYVKRQPATIMIQRKTLKELDRGKVYFMNIYAEVGVWVSSVWIKPTYKRTSYEVNSYKQ